VASEVLPLKRELSMWVLPTLKIAPPADWSDVLPENVQL